MIPIGYGEGKGMLQELMYVEPGFLVSWQRRVTLHVISTAGKLFHSCFCRGADFSVGHAHMFDACRDKLFCGQVTV